MSGHFVRFGRHPAQTTLNSRSENATPTPVFIPVSLQYYAFGVSLLVFLLFIGSKGGVGGAMRQAGQAVSGRGGNGAADRTRTRTVRFEVLLTPQEAQRIEHEASRRGQPVSAYARRAILGGVDHAEDVLERAIERIRQIIRHDTESAVAAMAAAATIVIGQVTNQRVPAEERSKAIQALTAYYRQHLAGNAQAGAGDDGEVDREHVG